MKSVGSGTIVERIVKSITDAIIDGELKPGEKIPTEIELMKTLDVGRNSLREAIKMLSAIGVLEIKRGDGTYITKKVHPSIFDSLIYEIIMEQSTQEEILELRKTLEVDILELATEKATKEDVKELNEILNKFHKYFRAGDFEKAAEFDLAFHNQLVDIAGNPLLGRIVKGVLSIFHPSVKKTLAYYQKNQGEIHSTHRQMVELLEKKDKANVENVVVESLLGWKEYVKQQSS